MSGHPGVATGAIIKRSLDTTTPNETEALLAALESAIME